MYGGAAAAVYAPLDSVSRAEQVERRLTDAIVLGLIPVDHQLPGEAELSRLLGVSTVTVREALRSMREADLIETRRGRNGGSFVKVSEESAVRRVVERLLRLSTAQLRDLGDRYSALSGAAAKLAAHRATPAEVARLWRRHDQITAATTEEERRRAESHLQIEIAAVAQSPLLFHEEVTMQAEIGPLLWLGAGHEEVHLRTSDLAGDVVAAIAVGDGDKARALTEDRVAAWTTHLVELRLEGVDG
jgi:GntR family transcriptional regulator, transcriptional repressor for pyruvate dehydrogenase complex